jgi:DNA polymerase kappa
MAVNSCKAGMVGLDRDRINRVVEEASRGSKFYAKKQADQARIGQQVEGMLAELGGLGEAELEAARLAADRRVAELRRGRRLDRTIVHVDMDMFYAAVEMRDNPALADVPMAVGSPGMLSTSNYKVGVTVGPRSGLMSGSRPPKCFTPPRLGSSA